ncbi:MAG: BatD family protein, partial [Deltaproteobacteria bacterium]|nr:BatD family protein [Deltaproteobacteria bacterium]
MRALAFFSAASTLLLAATAHGQGSSFTARLGRNPVGVGESFPFEIALSTENLRMENYRPPDFRGFRVVSEQPSQSTQIQMGGGGSLMRQNYTWHYQLVPLQKGKLVIGPASVRVAGRELRTDKVNVTVVEAGQAPQPRPRRRTPRGFPGFPDPSSLFPDFDLDQDFEPPAGAPARPGGQRNFLRVLPSKTRAFVGEQITV